MFPTIPIIFHLLMVSFLRKFYLASHSRDNPQQNSSFVCFMNVALPQVHQHKFLLLRTVRVRTSLVCWVLSWSRISSSSHAKFQNILIMLVGLRDTNNALYLNVFLRIFRGRPRIRMVLTGACLSSTSLNNTLNANNLSSGSSKISRTDQGEVATSLRNSDEE